MPKGVADVSRRKRERGQSCKGKECRRRDYCGGVQFGQISYEGELLRRIDIEPSRGLALQADAQTGVAGA
jgi:hypothetical protein